MATPLHVVVAIRRLGLCFAPRQTAVEIEGPELERGDDIIMRVSQLG